MRERTVDGEAAALRLAAQGNCPQVARTNANRRSAVAVGMAVRWGVGEQDYERRIGVDAGEMTAADKAPSLRVQHIEQDIGAKAERQRIRRAQRDALRELRRAFPGDWNDDDQVIWKGEVIAQLDAIDRATRAPKGERK